jgi:hypothetical protein
MTCTQNLRGDPIPWLLEEENPPVRYGTLRHLLERPDDDSEVTRAEAAIPFHPPVSHLLTTQKPDGYWIKRDYYLPKHNGTFWVLTVLADLGLTARNEQIQRACEFMFHFQRDGGAFCRHRRVAGRGLVWDTGAGPCTHARIVRFLIQFGFGHDPRLRDAIHWLLTTPREDGMWDCGRPSRPGCLRATLDVLRVAALDTETAAHPAIARAAAKIAELLMEPRMARYHVGHEWRDLEYPYFGYGLVPALDSLAYLGYTCEHPKIAVALEYLLSRQLPDGSWPLDQVPDRAPFDFGQPGTPSKWMTLDVLRVFKSLSSS